MVKDFNILKYFFTLILINRINNKGKYMKQDYTGQKFGRMLILKEAEPKIQPNGNRARMVLCQCDCGTIKTVNLASLKGGLIKSCGCYNREVASKTLSKKKILIEHLVEKKFGNFQVLKEVEPKIRNNGRKRRMVLCKCDCGKEKIVNLDSLLSGKSKSCGCGMSSIRNGITHNVRRKSIKHLIGKKYNRLTIISEIELKKYEPKKVLCRCDCGKEKIIVLSNIIKGKSKTCGCMQGMSTHKLSEHRLYDTWTNMKQRCLNPKNKKYNSYGGRGIKICNEWLNDFMNFYNWAMANGYKKGLTIDRINNDGNYEPLNCQWIPHKDNSIKHRPRMSKKENDIRTNLRL